MPQHANTLTDRSTLRVSATTARIKMLELRKQHIVNIRIRKHFAEICAQHATTSLLRTDKLNNYNEL